VGFWDKEYLKRLLLPGESPWNFEILGSYRTSYDDGFFMMRESLCSFTNMVEKGRWYPGSVRWAASEGLDIGLASRPVITGATSVKSLFQIFWYKVMQRVPWRLRLRAMNLLRKLLISY
jgi:hypothetical protein